MPDSPRPQGENARCAAHTLTRRWRKAVIAPLSIERRVTEVWLPDCRQSPKVGFGRATVCRVGLLIGRS